ncbi:MAG: hypothetical protein ACLGIR_08525 [Actinomycetes bacterium]
MTEQLHAPKSEALRTVFWRSEILQVLFWLRGEGLGEEVTPSTLERFLGVPAEHLEGYLARLVSDGLLTVEAGSYRLSPTGEVEGAAEFESAFAQLTRPAHGECSADCWCHVSVDEAEACLRERTAPHDHG